MKILHVTLAYEPAWHLGGVVRAVSQLCRGQAALGHQVTVYATDSGLDRRMEVDARRPVELGGVEVCYFRTEYSLRWGLSPNLRAACLANLRNFDIVHLSSPWAYPGIVAGRIARRLGIPYVMSMHGSLSLQNQKQIFKKLKKLFYLRLVEGCNFRGAKAIHFTSEVERQENSNINLKVPSFIVPNGVDVTEFENLPSKEEAKKTMGLPAGALLVLYFGRLESRKALDILLKAFAQALSSKKIPALLCLAGPDFGQGASLQQLASTLGVSEKVIFPGFISPEKRKTILAGADLMALVSHGENFGISAMEGMLAGVPALLSTNVGFHQEAVAAGAALAVPVQEKPMAQGLGQLLADPARLKTMGQAAYTFARSHYDNKLVAAAMTQAYEDVLTRRPSPQLCWSYLSNQHCFAKGYKF